MPKTEEDRLIGRVECELLGHCSVNTGSELDPTGQYYVCTRCHMIPFGADSEGKTLWYENAEGIHDLLTRFYDALDKNGPKSAGLWGVGSA